MSRLVSDGSWTGLPPEVDDSVHSTVNETLLIPDEELDREVLVLHCVARRPPIDNRVDDPLVNEV